MNSILMTCGPSRMASTGESSNVAKRNFRLDCRALAEHLLVDVLLAERRKREKEAREAAEKRAPCRGEGGKQELG